MTENQKLFDRVVEHAMDVRRHERYLLNEQSKITGETARELRSELTRDLRTPLAGLYRRYSHAAHFRRIVRRLPELVDSCRR